MAKNWALVIGINEYNPLNFTPLKYAKRDAEAVKAFFEDSGLNEVEVCCFTDDSPPLTMSTGVVIPTLPTYGNLISFLHDRFERPFLSTGDNCWFFFAGHGERHADRDYLMPIDANARGNKVIAGLLVDEVREWLTRSGADNVILLLDACRSEGGRGARGIDPTEQQGIITIASCNPTQKSWEVDELQQGVFTYALLEAMQLPGERSCATVERLGNYLKHRVPELCQRYGKAPAQLPRISVDPIEKQHFILMPQFARQADIDLMKTEGFRLAFEGKLQLAEQMFLRTNVAAGGRDHQALDALLKVRMQIQGMNPNVSIQLPAPPEIALTRETAATLSIEDVAKSSFVEANPQPTLAISTEPEDDLSSERNIDYHKLRDLLKAGEWKEADRETYRLMITTVGKKERDWFRSEELLNFPCADLKTIDHLWVKYSKGRFGFSVQKKIYVECGAKLDGRNPSDKIWKKFGDRVGWRKDGEWLGYSDLNPSLSSPQGNFPAFCLGGGRVFVGSWGFFSRTETCKL